MTLAHWLIVAVIAVVVGWVILQPQRWGKRDDSSDSGTAIGVDGTGRRSRADDDSDSGDGDGGGGDGGGD